MKTLKKASLLAALGAILGLTVQAQPADRGWRFDPATVAPQLFAQFDADGNGELSEAEFTELLTTRHALRQENRGRMGARRFLRGQGRPADGFGLGPDATVEERADSCLQYFDADGDEKLSREELEAMIDWRQANRPGPGPQQ